MGTTDRRLHRGTRHSQRSLAALGRELRDGRLAASLSQDRLGIAAGVAGSTVGRIERGEAPAMTVLQLSTLFAILGQRLSIRAYPEGPPLRDVAHARLLARLRALLPDGVTMRTEVPLGLAEDLRAWDAVIGTRRWRCHVEAETALTDLQATDRRIALKLADTGVDHVLLVVAATRRNRDVLREFRNVVAGRYPSSPRRAMAALRTGSCIGESSIVML